ncbi:hypothetical protein N658DRAFT_498422 [Parathielavia hyrcaniae]|uniref:Uncharacterized protein n=1 Tax=Parathielavia hyrcaniae TaxID=113614 RepID=A0AAN6Q1Y4_9PEZI|nr:hypothetical protein N658DRAFT_498422 [Parathielavia hyrcaniae]
MDSSDEDEEGNGDGDGDDVWEDTVVEMETEVINLRDGSTLAGSRFASSGGATFVAKGSGRNGRGGDAGDFAATDGRNRDSVADGEGVNKEAVPGMREGLAGAVSRFLPGVPFSTIDELTEAVRRQAWL